VGIQAVPSSPVSEDGTGIDVDVEEAAVLVGDVSEAASPVVRGSAVDVVATSVSGTDHLVADVVVVGAGPAGAAAAITLARAGRSVVLADKARFPRDKICGDGLTTGALRLLEDLGVQPESVGSWMPVHDVHVSGPKGHTVTFPLPRDRGQYAVVARRADLDHALVEQARAAGVTVVEEVSVSAIDDGPGHITVTFVAAGTEPGPSTEPGRSEESDPSEGLDTSAQPGHEPGDGTDTANTANTATTGNEGLVVEARYLVAADGMWSPTRKLLGTTEPGYLGDWHAFRQYFTDVSPKAKDLWIWFEEDLVPGYVWVFPLPDGRANVGFGIQRGGKVATKEMKALWPEILARPHVAEVLGPDARPENRHQAWPIPARVNEMALTSGRVLWVGDAAAATDPMTGEGIGQALFSGVLAAEAIVARAPRVSGAGAPSPLVGSSPAEAAAVRAHYEQAVARSLVPDHKMSALLVRALKHRKGARAAIRVAGLTAWTRRNFARWLFEDEPRAGLFTPRRWHRRFLTRDGAYRA
jgi:flavin-dependent dehydrogenase